MSRVVHKFATGEPVPDGAIYLSTVAQTSLEIETPIYDRLSPRLKRGVSTSWEPCWLVWHYFLVEVSS